MAELKINLEQGKEIFYAHGVELLGCFAKAKTRTEALDLILKDAKEYSKWLASKEIPKNGFKELAIEILKGINELTIIEEKTGIQTLGQENGVYSLFKSDQEPFEENTFTFLMELLKILPDELARIIFPIDKELQDKEIIPEKQSINEHLKALYQNEFFLITRFGIETEQQLLEAINMTKEELESLAILERCLRIRQGAIAILKAKYPKMDCKVFKNAIDTDFPEEPWTIKKIIRLLIENDREHTKAIEEIAKKIELNQNNEEE
ncbi:MAG: hypothetical protein U9O98_10145 [Asgard group archaeon]|nr:hypothetical protein [Asgard group archaeon]